MNQTTSRSFRAFAPVAPLVTLLAACSAATSPAPSAQAQSAAAPSAPSPEWAALTPEEREDWRKTMANTPLPREGCFLASHPSTAWVEIPCAPGATESFGSPPKAPGNDRAQVTVGGGGTNDFAASVPSGLITTAVGSFPSVSGLTSAGSASAFSLQMNSNQIGSTIGSTSTLCNGASSPFNCRGWEQFIYSSQYKNGLLIEFWLLNYGNTCPGGWTTSGNNCFINTTTTVPVPAQPITNLANMKLTATAGYADSVQLSTGNGQVYAGSWINVLSLEDDWSSAEFNVFGDGNSSNAAIDGNATVYVQTVTSGGGDPSCLRNSSTGETNSMTLATQSCCAFVGTPGNPDGILFQEYTAKPAAPACKYTGSGTSASGVANVVPTCTYDGSGDPIQLYEQTSSGTWQPVYSYPSALWIEEGGEPAFSVSPSGGQAGGQATFLACAGPVPPSTYAYAPCGYPVAPGSNGCDATATTVTFAPYVPPCAPSCPAGSCGEQADGCGGTINCGTCPVIPPRSSCGSALECCSKAGGTWEPTPPPAKCVIL